MRYFEFKADQIYCEVDENDIIVCSFAEGESSNPTKYIILQRSKGDEDLYSYEICNIDNSGKGSFNNATLIKNSLILDFNAKLKKKYNADGLIIRFESKYILDELDIFQLIFANSDCSLNIGI
jgi:hypothetical protein